jgi:outer membrane protein OmpA-like peptidoglycan-associated protein
MNKQCIYVPFALLVAALAGCSVPQKDVPGLSSGIDAANAGHYRQSIYHEQLAEEKLEEANKTLSHWKNDHYWNIDDRQKALDAAQQAAQHRLESEKELCQWLTEVHGHNHHQAEATQKTAAYFKTGSAIPYQTDDRAIAILGKYLESHPDATAEVIAYTDTVGSSASNQNLSERRAATVSKMLIEKGAKQEQLRVSALGEAHGPDNTGDQSHRIVSMVTVHPTYADCPNLK